ncbi:MAG: ydaF [Clostridiaceae bacterium]|jgi:ribosomal-protein-alanine N-acetyltransferase|nr:ydaF [Clostridiaceae bacterium]
MKDKMISSIQIENSKIILRMANVEDTNSVIKYFAENKEHLDPFEPKKPDKFYTYDFWENRIKSSIKEFEELKSLRLFIFEKTAPKEVIGMISFEGICMQPFHSCEMGYSISKDKQGKGYMRQAIELSIKYVFEKINLKRIMANYTPYNQKSGMLLKKLGFVIEGYARDYIYINDKWEDLIFTSTINQEWEDKDIKSL